MIYCDIVDGKPILKPTSHYYYQVQGQLHITGRKRCYFVLCTKNFLTFEIIEKDDAFWEQKMKSSLTR